MTISVTSPVTGGAQTGFTAPTYTMTVDNPPDNRSKQWAMTAFGGTQVGVVAHSVNAPATFTTKRPSFLKTLTMGLLNGMTGRYSKIPFNEYTNLVRKAAQVAADQWVVNEFRLTSKIFAGTETYDAPNVRAGYSLIIGILNQQSAGIGDTAVSGILG